MYLGDRGGGDWCFVKIVQQILNGTAEGALDLGTGLNAGEWRYRILQFGELIGKLQRQQIAPGGEDLAKLYEYGP